MKQGEIKETEGTFITPTRKVGVIKVPSKVEKSRYLISTYTNNPTSAIQTFEKNPNFSEKSPLKAENWSFYYITEHNFGAP